MDTLIKIVVTIGIPTIIGCFVYIGRKLQVLDDLKETVEKLKCNLKVVSDYLTKNNQDFTASELKAYSPLKLTPEGDKLIRSIGFHNVFEKNQRDFFSYIDSEEPKLKYDVEVAAIKSISALADKDYMDFLKIYFYNNPARNIANTAPTLGVYVRDKYLEMHPEITQ